MHPILRNLIILIVGIFLGGLVNVGLIELGPMVIPPPDAGDITSMEGLKASMSLFEPQHFIFPFLAHAVGTLVGAFFVAKFAATHHMRLAMVVGFFFLIGGGMMVMQLPSPVWFNMLDLVVAYIPMAWLGGRLAGRDFGLGREEI